MSRSKRQVKPLPTIWHVPDDLWEQIQEVLEELDPPAPSGATSYRCPSTWMSISLVCGPAASGTPCRASSAMTPACTARSCGGSKRACWSKSGPAVRCSTGSSAESTSAGNPPTRPWARLGRGDQSSNPTDRAKNGTKHGLLTEADGGPLSAVVAAANVHDTKLLEGLIEAIVVERPEPEPDDPQHLCLDKGFDNPTGWKATLDHQYVPHIRRIGEEKLDDKKRKGTRPQAAG